MRDDRPQSDAAESQPAPTAVETPRETRFRLNRLERSLSTRAQALAHDGHGPALVRLRGLFELAFTADHADYLTDEIADLGRATP